MAKCLNTTATRRGRAAIGVFLEKNETVYAVVCKHVTCTANGSFYIMNAHGKEMKIGKRCNLLKSELKDGFETFHVDIDLIKFNDEAKLLCHQIYRGLNENERKENAPIYEGPVETLFGKTVFYCYIEVIGGKRELIRKSGKVKHPGNDYGDIVDVIGNNSFMIDAENGKSFAAESDSGRIVLKEKDGVTILVGMITGLNFRRSNDACQASSGDGECTICLLLCAGLKHLKTSTGFDFNLYRSQYFRGNEDNQIEPSQTVMFSL